MFATKTKLSRRQMLRLVPHRNPAVQWAELDSGQFMLTYEKNLGLFMRLMMKVLHAARTAQVVLDDVGSRLVRQIDGTKTVLQLIHYVEEDLKLSRKEAEVALFQYLETLGRRGFVAFEAPPEEGE